MIINWQNGDWSLYFYPAVQNILNGQSPYWVEGFFSPVWVLIPLLPVALLSPALGSVVMFIINLLAYTFVLVKMRMNVLAIILFVAFSGMLSGAFNGNIEGLAALGFILPPQVGLFFVLTKPQFGIGVAVFWFAQAWARGGMKQVAKVFLPVSIALLASFLLFGLWPLQAQALTDVWWDANIFPYGIPIGFILLGLAIWKNDIRFAICSSPFFSPYVAFHTWSVVWLGLLALVPASWPWPALARIWERVRADVL